ncbi:glycosyltransferase family 2 protein [Pleomorphovibrio marinus]|uniref:glycosyltransferase family 2 protein n=1 Tax=Pleomorphovibrio marinus TaxID=2164132 RepID=UPI001300294E|nr:glycosyltransferase family 2 protein [Pleomorphovibrio marinus]
MAQIAVSYLFLYLFLFILLYVNWRKTLATSSSLPNTCKVALLIPFRNEDSNLSGFLPMLMKWIPESWEVFFIDDCSEDSSYQTVEAFIHAKQINKWSLIKSTKPGKKGALATGIYGTDAEIIITTDADMVLPNHNPWEYLLAFFSESKVNMVAGPIFPMQNDGMMAEFQKYEWASVQLVTGATFGLQRPLICSGANLAFRKSAFRQVGGYKGNEHLLSGDDEFLLKKFVRQFGADTVVFANDPLSAVFFKPFEQMEDLLKQRIRWASKWNDHNNNFHSIFSIAAFILSVFPLLTPLFFFIGEWGVFYFLGFWTAKLSMDKLVLGKVIQTYGQRASFKGVVITGLLHPLYVLATGWGVARGSVLWKGRKIK